MKRRLRRCLPGALGLVIVLILGVLMLPAGPSQAEIDRLAARFHFDSSPLSTEQWSGTPLRKVMPHLERVSAWISAIGSGVSLYDIDGDGLPNDICLVDSRFNSATVEPAPGTGDRYPKMTLAPAGLPYSADTTAPISCAAGDVNEDGLTDLIVSYYGRSPVLFLRQPGVALGSPDAFVARDLVSPPQIWNTDAVNIADLDGDGHADILVGNFFPDGAPLLDTTRKDDPGIYMNDGFSHATNGGHKHVFLWQGATGGNDPTVTFHEIENVFSDEVSGGWTFAAGTQDLNGDGLPEVYFANDFGKDNLLVNHSTPGHLRFDLVRGRRTFTTPKSKVLGMDSFKGMGVDFADLNGDGWPDIIVSNITSNYAFHESNEAYLSTGDIDELSRGVAPYTDGSEQLGLSQSGWGWDIKAGDFDNSGQPEIVQAVGFVRGETNRWPQLQEFTLATDPLLRNPAFWPEFGPGADLSGHEQNAFFVRAGDGRFVNINSELNLPQPGISHGLALGDVDHDGRLDFAVANQWAPSYLMHNTAPHVGQYLGLQLRMPATNGPGTVPAIGASIRVTRPDGKSLVSQVYPAGGHHSVSAPESMFGLGDSAAPVVAEIRWRDTTGTRHTSATTLAPGWHTLLLTPDGQATEAEK
ncbi:CRTAC1 family protein [Nocardia colli]|uniref:CRTAC1 family protein n=1 Tax=Nocardia colli TaxID=2545717 RepID=A0A5N0DYM9_9NOCA|nr:CRTAC1 family protein [Nocardia colli]KAA8880651.1 CRTAC1 family protein [Nocardia colli]